ncbi:MAG: hypothetical protein K0R61_3911 [Microvirga sp.]|nr:hypothetical protein [Microvirga sp.]
MSLERQGPLAIYCWIWFLATYAEAMSAVMLMNQFHLRLSVDCQPRRLGLLFRWRFCTEMLPTLEAHVLPSTYVRPFGETCDDW